MKTTNILGICLLLIVSFIAVTLKAQERQQHGNGTTGTETYLEQQMRLEREKALKNPSNSKPRETSSDNDKKPLFVSDYDRQRLSDRYNSELAADKKLIICKDEWLNGDLGLARLHLDECKSSWYLMDNSLVLFIYADCVFNMYIGDGTYENEEKARHALYMANDASKGNNARNTAINFETAMLYLLESIKHKERIAIPRFQSAFDKSINGSIDYYAIQALVQLSEYCVAHNEFKKALKYCNKAYDRNHTQEYAYLILTQRAKINELLSDEQAKRNDLDEIAKIYSGAKDVYMPTCACSSMNSLLMYTTCKVIDSISAEQQLTWTKCAEIENETFKHEVELKRQIFNIVPEVTATDAPPEKRNSETAESLITYEKENINLGTLASTTLASRIIELVKELPTNFESFKGDKTAAGNYNINNADILKLSLWSVIISKPKVSFGAGFGSADQIETAIIAFSNSVLKFSTPSQKLTIETLKKDPRLHTARNTDQTYIMKLNDKPVAKLIVSMEYKVPYGAELIIEYPLP